MLLLGKPLNKLINMIELASFDKWNIFSIGFLNNLVYLLNYIQLKGLITLGMVKDLVRVYLSK